MQVKRLRSDFVVDESISLKTGIGKYAMYQVRKSGLTTHEALQQISRSWNIPPDRICYAGLKDKHAETSQFFTIERGPATLLQLTHLDVKHVGQCHRHLQPQDIVSNRFSITLRRLDRTLAGKLLENATNPTLCVPNYFDNQRFGSLGESGDFIAHAWCLRNYERALFLALADFNVHDTPEDRENKRILQQHWGEWEICKSILSRSHTRSVITYLVDHPTGFKKAVALIRRDLRSLYVAAFQAKLWNEMAVRFLRQKTDGRASLTIAGKAGDLLVPTDITASELNEWRKIRVPLPSGRKSDWPAEFEPLFDQVLEPYGMQRHELRFSFPRDVFFARGLRDLLLRPSELSGEIGEDETSKSGHCKLQLNFALPAAQYATMLLKVIEATAGTDAITEIAADDLPERFAADSGEEAFSGSND